MTVVCSCGCDLFEVSCQFTTSRVSQVPILNHAVQEMCEQAMEDSKNSLKAAQLACQSLRRAVQDMRGLRKALKKMKPVPASTDDDNSKAKNVMNGRTNLSLGKAVNLTDPQLLQGFKEILPKREIRTVKDPKELVGFAEAARPFLVRKGRSVLRLLAKTDAHRTMLDNTIENFRQTVVKSQDTKSVRLVKVK